MFNRFFTGRNSVKAILAAFFAVTIGMQSITTFAADKSGAKKEKVKFKKHTHCHRHQHKHGWTKKTRKVHNHRHCHTHVGFFRNTRHSHKRFAGNFHKKVLHKDHHKGLKKKSKRSKKSKK